MCFCYAAFLDQFMLFHKFWRVSYFNSRGRGFQKIFDNWWTQENLRYCRPILAHLGWRTEMLGDVEADHWPGSEGGSFAPSASPRPRHGTGWCRTAIASPGHPYLEPAEELKLTSVVFLLSLTLRTAGEAVCVALTGMILITNHFEQQSFVDD